LVLLHVINSSIVQRVYFPIVAATSVASVVPSRVLEIRVHKQSKSCWLHVLNVVHYVEQNSLQARWSGEGASIDPSLLEIDSLQKALQVNAVFINTLNLWLIFLTQIKF